jgi:hypothetical protein
MKIRWKQPERGHNRDYDVNVAIGGFIMKMHMHRLGIGEWEMWVTLEQRDAPATTTRRAAR